MKCLLFIIVLFEVVSIGHSQESTKPVMGLHKPKQSPVIPPAPTINLEAFDNSLELFKAAMLDLNENYISNLHLDSRDLPRIALEDAAITVRTEVKIAEETGDIIVLNPLDALSIMLYRFAPNGALRWKKEIDPDGEGFNLADRLLSLEISSDGKVIVVYETVFEDRNVLGVYDERGNPLLPGKDAPSAIFAPSGNYFYGSDRAWEGDRLEVYDLRALSPVDIVSDFYPPPLGTHNTYNYRIFENDILAVALQSNEAHRMDTRELYLYDLKTHTTVYHKTLSDSNGNVEARASLAELKGGHFVCRVLDRSSRNPSILIVDLQSGESRVLSVSKLISMSLSIDGDMLITFRLPKSDHWATIVNLNTNATLFSGRLDLPKLAVDAFTIRDSVIRILCDRGWRSSQGSKLFELTIDGVSRLMAEGWINLKRWQRLLPVRDPDDSTKTIISILN